MSLATAPSNLQLDVSAAVSDNAGAFSEKLFSGDAPPSFYAQGAFSVGDL